MKALKYTLFVLVILIIGFSIYVAAQPSSFNVKRSRVMNIPSSVVYNHVADFKTWESWSTWVEKNPETVITLPEKTVGVESSYAWEDKDGTGTIKTIAVTPNSISQEMQFDDYEPSKITWIFQPNPNGQTQVTWNMHSENVPFMFKAFGVLSGGFDKMIGPDFERSLEKLEGIALNSMEQHNVSINGVTEYQGVNYIYKTITTPSENISNAMGDQFGILINYMTNNNMTPFGAPFTIYPNPKSQNDTEVTMSNAIPIENKVNIEGENEIKSHSIPKVKVLKTTLTGNYTYLSKAWKETYTYIERNGIKIDPNIPPFEVYANDPGSFANPANWITEIYIPIK